MECPAPERTHLLLATHRLRLALVLVLLAAGLTATPGSPASGSPLPGPHLTGTLSVLAGQIDPQCNKNGQPADSTCTKFSLTNCVGNDGAVLPELIGYYSVARELAPGAARGMVLFFSGGGGNYYWTNDAPDFMQALRSVHGFDVAQVRWAGAWQDAAAGQDAGAGHVACRPATAIKHIRETLYTPPATTAPGRCGFCLVGSSGGASQIAYALTHYGLEGIIDAIIPTGGPTHAAQSKGCAPGRAESAYQYDGASTKQIDAPSGYTKTDSTSPWYLGNGPCKLRLPSWKPRWDAESVETSGNDYSYGNSRVHMLVGREDSVIRNHTGDFATRLWLQGSPYVTYEIVTGMGHGVTSSPAGMASLEAALLGAGGVTACNNGIDDDDDGLTDWGPGGDPGCASATDPNEITPGGAACDDGLDNDGDGRIDSGPANTNEDPGCAGPGDASERDPSLVCDDGVDNDANGTADFPADLGCTGANDGSEGSFVVVSILNAGPGTGTVAVSPGPSPCAPPCYRSLALNTVVTLTAQPASGSTFAGWAGACAHTNPVCDFTATNSKTATATFDASPGPVHLLTVDKDPAGTGTGTVTSSPPGVECDAACPSDAGEFVEGTSVILTATGSSDSAFAGWGGACVGVTGPQCTVSMTEARTVSARFDQVSYTLTVTVSGGGDGSVSSDPSGITDCRKGPQGTCSFAFPKNTQITLTATADPGSVGGGFLGSCQSGTDTCTFAIQGDSAVTATFNLAPTSHTLTVDVNGPGSVSSEPPGIDDCRESTGTCVAQFDVNQSVVLSATEDPGATFAGFTGDCNSSSSSCPVTMSAPRTVVATFTSGTPPLEVTITDSGFTPKSPAAIQVGRNVRWTSASTATRPHSAVSNKNLGPGGAPYFDSGSLEPGQSFVFPFRAAGRFPYLSASPGDSAFTGTITVAMTASPSSGSTATVFALVWASEAMDGYAFDVEQRHRPLGGTFAPWKKFGGGIQSQPSATFDPDQPGTYQFRTRLKNTATSVVSGWSPTAAVTVN
ncbi:MAG: hypothetical protein WD770_10925 [Actinomycetota bacterium]